MTAALPRALFALLLLTACALPSAGVADDERELTFLTWSSYIDPQLVAEFESEFDARVRFMYFDSDDLRDVYMADTDGAGYDLVMVAGAVIKRYIGRGWLAELEPTTSSHFANIDPRWYQAYPYSRGHAVPYAWGTLGIAYRRDLTGRALTSWLDLYQPEPGLHGRILMLDSTRDLVGMGLKALGHSANSTDPQALARVDALLKAQQPHVRHYGYIALSPESVLVTGEVYACMVYSGDALVLRQLHPHIEFALPREGGNLWVDFVAVTAWSPRKQLATDFIDFINRPPNAARNALFTRYAPPNRAAEAYLPRAFLDDPIIYPGDNMLSGSQMYLELPPR